MPTTITDASHRTAAAETMHQPNSLKQLQAIVQAATQHSRPLTTVGGKSGLTGGSVPLFGGDAIDMSGYLVVKPRLGYESFPFKFVRGDGNYLLSAAKPRTGIFPAGVTLAEMDELLTQHNLFYAPKPGYMGGQLGGAVATNASGPRTLAFGDTRANVVSLEIVLPNGEIVRLDRKAPAKRQANFRLPSISGTLLLPTYLPIPTKNAAGFYSSPSVMPIDLFVGCEGTLGIFTEIEVKLIGRQPIATRLLFFQSIHQAFNFINAARAKSYSSARPTVGGILSLEFMDNNALSFVTELLQTQHIDISKISAAVEVEYFTNNDKVSELVNDYARRYHAMDTSLDASFIMKLRYSIPQAVNTLMAKRGFIKIASDFAVPGTAFPKMYAAYQAADAAMAVVNGQSAGSATWGHIGNYHLHWNALPNSKAAVDKALELYKTLGDTAVALGGTLSAEHGTGKKQLIPGEPLLYTMDKAMYAYAVSLIEQINPGYLLNRGNMIGYPSLK